MRPTQFERTGRGFVLIASLWLALAAGVRAQERGAERLELDWVAPAGCPARAELERAVRERLSSGNEAGAPGPALRASGSVTASDRGYRLELETEHGRRSLAAGSCREAASAAALILALLIDPEAETAPAPPPVPPPRSLWLSLRAEVSADWAILPELAFGPGLAAGVRWRATSFELTGTWLPPRDAYRSERDSAVANLSLLTAALGACHALTRAPELSPCLRIEHGRLIAEPRGLPNARSHGAAWTALWAGARLGVRLASWLWANLELAVGLPLLGATFTVNSVGTAHETGDVTGRLRAGIEIRL
jgi:hypothetical protein